MTNQFQLDEGPPTYRELFGDQIIRNGSIIIADLSKPKPTHITSPPLSLEVEKFKITIKCIRVKYKWI